MNFKHNYRSLAALIGSLCLLLLVFHVKAQVSFTDVAPQMGIADMGTCGGMFWCDIDNDGDMDLIQARRFGGNCYIYRNDGETFSRLENIGLPTNWDAGQSFPMDFDHDGDLDIFFAAYGDYGTLRINQGDHFDDGTTQVGLPQLNGMGEQKWVDFNRDGWMDILYVLNSGFRLYENHNGHFVDATDEHQLPHYAAGHRAAEADVDLDGDMDLFCSVQGGQDYFFINEDGHLVDWTHWSGLDQALAQGGCVWIDVDHDKYPDLLTQGNGNHTIWHNNGDRTFTEMRVHGTERVNDTSPYGACYAAADFNADGLVDFYAARPGGCGGGFAPNQFFICDSMNISTLDIWYHDMAPAWGMDYSNDGACVPVDFDMDGDIDLFLATNNGASRLFRNNLNDHHDLQIRLLGPNGEQDRWLSRVELYDHGSQTVVQSSQLNTSGFNCNGMNNYFAVDPNGHYDLKIYFSDGTIMTPENFPQLGDVVPSQVNHLLEVRMGQSVTAPEKPTAKPADFALTGAYPNPFNAQTTLKYSVPEAGRVSLAVFNIAGQHVADLLSGYVSKGEHEFRWDASRLASGVYLTQLRFGNRIVFAKAVLLK